MDDFNEQKKGPSNMTLRVITGFWLMGILLAAFFLKIFVSKLFFDLILVLMAGFGTWEMLRAFSDKIHISQKVVVMIFAVLIIIVYAVSDFYFADILHVHIPGDGETIGTVEGRNYALHITLVFFIAGVSILLAFLVFAHENITLESTGYALFSYIYPSLLLLVVSITNHLEYFSEIGVLFIFVVPAFADSFAMLTGKALGKRLPLKIAPNISPKKTLVGTVGGLVGGGVGALAIFFVLYGLNFIESVAFAGDYALNLDVLLFVGLGIFTAAFSQFGDLVESAIKRKLDIKDMGHILPGHGGVLDRIDSALFASLVVCIVIVLRLMIRVYFA